MSASTKAGTAARDTSGARRSGRVLRLAVLATAGGLLATLPATLTVAPYTLAAYFGLARPLLLLGLGCFVVGALLYESEQDGAT